MFRQTENQIVFRATVNGTPCRKFAKKADAFMNATWTAFNRYAKGRGFTEVISDGRYLGALAWRNPATAAVMELRAD